MLLAPLIVLNFFFFILLSITGSGLNNFLVAALGALHATPPALANTALTGILVMSAIGVLIGGVLATRIPRHGLIAGLSLLVVAVTTWAVAMADPGALLLVMIFSIGGLASGIAMPSRDMIVRAVTPPGAFGRVFGFVTTGFNIGGMISPLIFGLLLDYNRPREIFLFIAVCALISIATVAVGTTRKAPA
jgi:MFS family permease